MSGEENRGAPMPSSQYTPANNSKISPSTMPLPSLCLLPSRAHCLYKCPILITPQPNPQIPFLMYDARERERRKNMDDNTYIYRRKYGGRDVSLGHRYHTGFLITIRCIYAVGLVRRSTG